MNIPKPARRWAAIVAAWLIFGLFNGTQTYVTRAYLGRVPWWPVYAFALLDALVWAALTPVILLVAERFSPSRVRWRWVAATQFLAGIIFAFIHLWVFVKLLPQVGYYTVGQRSLFLTLMPIRLQFDLLTYWLLAGLRQAMEYYQQVRERERRASQLETSLVQARLQALRMQLQPHFLFNTLNTISSLMYKDVPAADRVLNRLAGFLRLALETARSQEVCLQTELEYTDRYLDIEKVRFLDRLVVEHVIQPDVLDALVPTLILQPLVENAIRHGVGARAGGGKMWIRASRRENNLLVEVEDEGKPPHDIHEGVGITNARSRLATLYGDRQRLAISTGASGGFRVAMELPYRAGNYWHDAHFSH
ncbi:MAG TPA: histidine kinase [Bryobacteraceae bacterium]|nr:histidine kinase [Bryobacteraceae bacterium]